MIAAGLFTIAATLVGMAPAPRDAHGFLLFISLGLLAVAVLCAVGVLK